MEGSGRGGTDSLKDAFGSIVELTDESGNVSSYRIMAELEVDGGTYAVLQSAAMRKEGDVEVFRIVRGTDGQVGLETVEDDDEWERVAEAYDDLQFGSDEKP